MFMSEDLDAQLRAALRPVAPDHDFSRRLIAEVAANHGRVAQQQRFVWVRRRPAVWWYSAGIAACLLLAIGVQHGVERGHERASGLEAKRQVLQALRVTSQKLDLAYSVIKTESSSLADEKSGV
jgi:hypothetical protein